MFDVSLLGLDDEAERCKNKGPQIAAYRHFKLN